MNRSQKNMLASAGITLYIVLAFLLLLSKEEKQKYAGFAMFMAGLITSFVLLFIQSGKRKVPQILQP